MQPRTNGNGQQRGQQGRPDIKAKDERGEALIRSLMAERHDTIKAMFSRDADAEASYTRAVGLAVSAYTKIAAESNVPIDEYSVVQAALWSFQRKLDPGTEVYFVPYGGKVTPIVSPQGLINLAFRSGLVLDCQARWVFRAEVQDGNFDHLLGSEEWVKHKKGSNARPTTKADSWSELEFAYAIINLKGGGRIIEVHDRADIEYYRSLSKAKAGLWFDWPAEAARKAVLKQALGRAPKQSEVSEILVADAAHEASLEIPEDFMRAVEQRIGADVVGAAEVPGAPAAPKSDPGAKSNGNGVPPAKSGPPQAGDASKVFMPGKRGEAPTVADASDDMLADVESKMRRNFDANEWDKPEVAQYKSANITRLATIRAEMKRRGLAHPDHATFGAGLTAPQESNEGALSPEEEERIFAASNGAAG